MKLIEQSVLVFRLGRTEKVYEVDLCEVGPGQYVVNFRYGRRGGTLKDGTRTVAPVAEAEARKIYDRLVSSKRQQGYDDGDRHAVAPEVPEAPAAPETPAPAETPTAVETSTAVSNAAPVPRAAAPTAEIPDESDPRKRAVLARLARGDAPPPTAAERPRRRFPQNLRHLAFRRRRRQTSPADRDWSLSRAIWRAGELRIESAAPLLERLIGTGRGEGAAVRDYSIAFALGMIGNPQGIEPLTALRGNSRTPDHVRRIATAALLELLDGERREALLTELAATLPAALRRPIEAGTADEVTEALAEHLTSSSEEPYSAQDPLHWAALETLCLMNTERTRPAALAALAEAPLKPPAFQRLRRAFKLAEMRRDAQVFGLLAHRFATTSAMFKNSYDGSAVVPDRSGNRQRYMGRRQLRAMLGSARPTAAYGSNTRWYLRQRVWRTLRRLGELGDPAYVPMAVGVLLPFTDSDGREPIIERSYRRGRIERTFFDRYSRYWAFNHILFLNSRRYQKGPRRWKIQGRYRPGEAAPQEREEAFPKLWNDQPAALLHLISDSRCEVVHEFAARTLAAQRDFCAGLPADAIAMIVGAAYEASARLGFDLAQRRFRPGVAETDLRTLTLAVVDSILADVRAEGHQWIRSSPRLFLGDGRFLAGLVTSTHSDTRDFGLELLRDNPLGDDVARALFGSLTAHLMAFGDGDEEIAADLVETLKQAFPSLLTGIGDAVINDLAGHALAPVQAFAAWLLLEGRAGTPSEQALEALLDSRDAEVRALGARVLGLLNDDTLRGREQLLWTLTTHRDAEMRRAIRPTVHRLIRGDADFGQRFLQMLIAGLLRRRLAEGVPGHVVAVLREDFAALLDGVPEDIMWRLLNSKSTAAQELGGILLPERVDASTVRLERLVELASNDVLSIREASWRLLERAVPRLKADMETATGVLDAAWEDSRIFAFKLFEEHFEAEDWSPAVLVAICDSVRPDVQRFGRGLITRHFDEASGDEYLKKLAEHPASDVQLFATNFLDRFADSAEDLAQLEPYFVRTLSGINRGRAAKQRIHAFLHGQAAKSEEAARVVARILGRLSATQSIEGRAAAIETLALIDRTWPGVETPLQVRQPELRQSGDAA